MEEPLSDVPGPGEPLLRRHNNDTSEDEKKYEKENTLRGIFYDCKSFYCKVYAASVLLGTLSLPVIITGTWALVQCKVFFPMGTTQASFIISVMVIIVGVLALSLVFGYMLCVHYHPTFYRDSICLGLSILMPLVPLSILGVILTALGIAAGALIPDLSSSIRVSANNSLFTIPDSQEARDAWNAVQSTLKCCGVVEFSDYEEVFDNYSVPVSCCNTTNPLNNETTCPDIVMDTNQENITDLIYTEGCAPQLVSFFRYIHSVVAGVSIIIGLIPIIGGGYVPLAMCIARFYYAYSTSNVFKYFLPIVGFILVFGLAFISVAIWSLIQNLSFYYSITAPANFNVVLLSVLLIIAGGLMIGASICQIATLKAKYKDNEKLYNYKKAPVPLGSFINKNKFLLGECCCVCLCVLPMLLLALVVGIVAATGISGPTSVELSSTLEKYLDNQTVQETWNDLQQNMECCGVYNFTDYETVFDNFSVPVSCCNTTSPLASECPDIVRNTQQMINQTGLIYYEGCSSHVQSFFNNIISVVSKVSITFAGLQIAAVLIWLWCFSTVLLTLIAVNQEY